LRAATERLTRGMAHFTPSSFLSTLRLLAATS
jgi:hypothetical protein